jgi:hypothetical protein
MSNGRYMGRAQSALLLLLEIYLQTGEGMELEPSPLNGTRSAPHLRLSVGFVESLGNWLSSS